ncbi:Type I restriction modification DNA specificity domain-containing protein [Burkholderia pseudomallei]
MRSELLADTRGESSWPTVSLSSIATKIRSGATPKGGGESYLESRTQYVLVRSQNVFDHRFDEAGLANISNKQARDLAGAELQDGDVLLNITGDGVTFGRACLVPKHVLPACVNQHVMLIRTDSALCHSGYLAAWLALPESKAYIESFNAGGSRRAITKGHIESFKVPLPPLDIQRGIADLAANFNARIDLLRQINATLESVAQTLFKSWFIDFDPVRAKAEGREPEGMDAATAALFPAEFEESALGLIPKGWQVGTFGELAELVKGSVNPLSSPNTVFEHYSLPAFDTSQLPVFEAGGAIKSNKTKVPAGAVLQSKLNPHIPRVWFPSRVGESAVCSTEFLPWLAVKPASPELIYCVLTSLPFEAAVRTLVTGTSNSHQRVKSDQVAGLSVVVAPQPACAAFAGTVRPLLTMIGENRWAEKTLADLRDTLLPRLISGKLCLQEASEQIEEAAACWR